MTCERNFALFEQEHTSGCGPATLRMFYSGYGIRLTEKQIIREMGMGDDGASWQEMQDHLEKYGFPSTLFRSASWEDLLREGGNCHIIICYQTHRKGEPDSHFSFLHLIDELSLTVLDPSLSDTYVYKRDLFEPRWFDDEGRRNFLAVEKTHVMQKVFA